MKEQIFEMYIDAAKRLDQALKAVIDTEQGSHERDYFEQVYGERQAYGRILKELCGVKPVELQKILDDINQQSKEPR